ncbi:hypothetical protein ZMTM_05740 [Methyloradius palustris]|uniref:Uncharacterized protein n=2 Tax=Methyloradius palustris TaxID=2778876 RepID=A0A8D5G268_9PROT|nr:hypothetical protein ZMTM_05740 [Methyloradius palustris]
MQEISNIKASQAKAYHLFLLSISPLGLIGIPRLLAGKDMETWAAIFQLYLFIAFGLSCVHPMLNHFLLWSLTGFDFAMKLMLGLGAIAHVGLVVEDASMFYRIDQHLRKRLS